MSRILIRDCRVFDGQSDELTDNCDVLLVEDRIAEISSTPISSANDQSINVGGATLMPGLIDAHYHAYAATVDLPSLDTQPMALLSQQARILLEKSLQRGFTSVRDAAGADFGLAQAVELGLIDGPRIFFSGKAISQSGGHGDFRKPGHIEPCGCGYNGLFSQLADGEDEVRKVVRNELRHGATQIKLFLSGGIISPSDPIWMPQFSDQEITAAVEEATARRTYVMAHAHTDDAIRRAIELGIRTIEHATMMSSETAELAADIGAYTVPTLSIIKALQEMAKSMELPASDVEKLDFIDGYGVRAVENAVAAGVKVGFGTDLLGDLQEKQLTELLLRSELQSNADVLRSATSVNADILMRSKDLGKVAVGAIADLLVVQGDPLQDISILTRPEENLSLIMKGGRIFKNELQSKH